MLAKRDHKIDFKKPIGVVELQVKLKENGGETKVKNVKPPLLPKRDNNLTLVGKSALNTEEKVILCLFVILHQVCHITIF